MDVIKIRPCRMENLERYGEIYAEAFSGEPWNDPWDKEDAMVHVKELWAWDLLGKGNVSPMPRKKSEITAVTQKEAMLTNTCSSVSIISLVAIGSLSLSVMNQ